MTSMFTPVEPINDPEANGTPVATVIASYECRYCRSLIVSGQRWVREKIYETSTDNGPQYCRYHADLFVDKELSCWERHQMELETVRAARAALRVM
jgi:hypothetical protein